MLFKLILNNYLPGYHPTPAVAYFNQCLGAAHLERWLFHLCTHKLKKERKSKKIKAQFCNVFIWVCIHSNHEKKLNHFADWEFYKTLALYLCINKNARLNNNSTLLVQGSTLPGQVFGASGKRSGRALSWSYQVVPFRAASRLRLGLAVITTLRPIIEWPLLYGFVIGETWFKEFFISVPNTRDKNIFCFFNLAIITK